MNEEYITQKINEERAEFEEWRDNNKQKIVDAYMETMQEEDKIENFPFDEVPDFFIEELYVKEEF